MSPAARRRPEHPVVRAARAALLDLAGKRIAVVTMVVDDHFPEIVMFEGEPFLASETSAADVSAEYVQKRPYRADAMVIEEGVA